MKTIKNIQNFLNLRLKLISMVLFAFMVVYQTNTWTMNSLDCSRPLHNIDHESDLDCIRAQNLKPVQLLTELFRSSVKWRDSMGRDAFKGCPENRCFAFRYKSNSQVALEGSDGVVVHAPNLYRFPTRNTYHRRHKQLWSFYTLEPQRLSLCLRDFNITDLDDWFNLTKTVKSNYSYFSYDMKHLHRFETYQNAYLNFKTKPRSERKQNKKLAFWFVSNCYGFSHRKEYVQELQKYIEIDIYGKCDFNNSKPDPCETSPNKTQCFKDLYSSYKFYLSFENSKCDYYITEKYFKLYYDSYIFDVDLIPIVRGAKLDHYLSRAPSNYSFIFADSFPTPQSLANYLMYLDHNQTAYDEYLSWKRELITKLEDQQRNKSKTSYLKPDDFFPLCELCEKLHDETYLNSKNNPIVKISEYYNPVKDCARDEVNQTEEELLSRMRENCYWADYHQHIYGFFHSIFG